jgi:hypothetical protein
MAIQRNLKAFVRYDGSGRVVAGSLILRKNKPKVGRWQEIPAYECCNPDPTVLYFSPNLPYSYPSVTIYCDEVQVDYAYVQDSTSITTVDQLVEALNTDEGTRAFGTYSNAGPGGLQLTVPLSVKNRLCPNGTLAFTSQAD